MKIFLVCFDKDDVIDIVAAKTPKEAYKNTEITDDDVLSDLTLIELTESNIEKIESIKKGFEQNDEEMSDIYRDRIKDVYRNQLSNEQFKEFAFDWIEVEAITEYIDGAIESEMNINTLKQWLNEAKEYLNVKQ